MSRKTLLAAAVSAAAAMLVAGPVCAHAKLQASVPASNAQLTQAPNTLRLTFDEAVKLAVLKLVTGGKATSLTLDHSAKGATSVTLPLPVLAPGQYEVDWTALAVDDGHVTKGSFSFTIVGAAPAPQ